MEVDSVLLTTKQAVAATGVKGSTMNYWLRTGRVAAFKPEPEADTIGYRIPVGMLRGYLRKVMHDGGRTEQKLDEWLAGEGREIVESQRRLEDIGTQVLESRVS